ncbi:hypothetical protein G6F31_021332 [Rhizopus arrhizus]|nr:hypothetical protein G6F31_021332 [Rhizopus arrhizus]
MERANRGWHLPKPSPSGISIADGACQPRLAPTQAWIRGYSRTSRFLAISPCSLPMPRARCRVSTSSSAPTAATTIATSGEAAIGSTFTPST